MDTTNEFQFKIGDEVITVDNRKLGKIIEITPSQASPSEFVVDQGRLNDVNLTIPVDTISKCGDGIVYLTVSEKEANGNRTGEF